MKLVFGECIDWYGAVHILRKGSFTYYVITKGEGGRNDYANVIFALSNAEFDYGRGEGV